MQVVLLGIIVELEVCNVLGAPGHVIPSPSATSVAVVISKSFLRV